MSDYLRRAQAADVSWPLDEGTTENAPAGYALRISRIVGGDFTPL